MASAESPEAHLGLRHRGGRLIGAGLVRFLPWDTEFFGFPCAAIDPMLVRGDSLRRYETAVDIIEDLLAWCRQRGIRFITIKIPGPDPLICQAFEDRGFRVTDNVVCLNRTRGNSVTAPAPPPGFHFSSRVDNPKTAAQAFHRLFKDGRFHNDRHISRETADRLWEAAILNQLQSEARDILFLENASGLVGLATAKPVPSPKGQSGRAAGSLFIFGLREEHRGRGLGKVLLSNFVERTQDHYSRLQVETSAFNRPAIRLYQGHGFILDGAKLSLHWWGEEK